VAKGEEFVVSVTTSSDFYYPFKSGYLNKTLHNYEHSQIPVNGGVFVYSLTDFPNNTFGNSFYFRDVRFLPDLDSSETGLRGAFSDIFVTDGLDYNLGTIFQPAVAEQITHVRVYSDKNENGDHTVRIYRRDNQQLVFGPVNWNYGGDGRWIELDITSSNVRVNGGVEYVVAITTPPSQYFPISYGFFNSGRTNNRNISFPANAGVFTSNPSQFPTTFNGNGYLRDVRFVAD